MGAKLLQTTEGIRMGQAEQRTLIDQLVTRFNKSRNVTHTSTQTVAPYKDEPLASPGEERSVTRNSVPVTEGACGSSTSSASHHAGPWDAARPQAQRPPASPQGGGY